MAVDRNAVLAWFTELQRVYAENRDYLTELDSAIGDADHGSNMERGFTAVKAELEKNAPASIDAIFKTVAMVLIKTVGGASGPLYGTFFLRAATECAGKTELEAFDIMTLFLAGIEGIEQRGKAASGEKTMLDALRPGLEGIVVCLPMNTSIGDMMDQAAANAKYGMQSTIPLQARKGRASYLGARSVGHQDPGATSAYLLIRAAADAWRSA
jgi:dihydroxyacetone kinase-like protein